MGGAARRLDTWQDLRARDRPDGPVSELVHGEIVHKALPRFRHGHAGARLLRILGPQGDDPGPDGWWLAIEPDVLLDVENVVRPDLAGWRRSTLPDPPDDDRGPIATRPDWICEILSAGHEAHDTRTKRGLYLEAAVPHYWLVNPMIRTLEAFERRDDRWTLLGTWGDGDRVRVAPFDTVDVDVGGLFVPARRDQPE